MLKKHFTILLSAILLSCNPIVKTQDFVVGKWILIEPVKINRSISITQVNCELTKKGNAFKKIIMNVNGQDIEAEEVGKYEVDGNRIILDNGTIFTMAENNLLITEQTLPSIPDRKFILKFRKL